MNGQRDLNRPARYAPVAPIPVAQAMPYPAAMPIVPIVLDHRDAAIAELQAKPRMVLDTQAQYAQGGRIRTEESDEELEPFVPCITNTPFPPGFKVPHLSTYDGTTDPMSHISTFNVMMWASNVNSEHRCMLFPTTLTGPAKSWFDEFRRHL